jgi:hypothetical protein
MRNIHYSRDHRDDVIDVGRSLRTRVLYGADRKELCEVLERRGIDAETARLAAAVAVVTARDVRRK